MTLTNYWWLLIWMFTGAAFLAVFMPKREEIVLGKKEMRWTPLAAVLAVLPYIIWAGFRGDNFGDSLLSSKIQKNLSEKWHFFKNAAFFDFFEVPVFSRNVANPNFA